MLALGLSADRSASVAGGRHRRWLAARLVWVALVVAALVAAVGEGAGAAPDPSCATPFRVFTDPADPGTATVHGPITTVRDSGVLGAFSG